MRRLLILLIAVGIATVVAGSASTQVPSLSLTAPTGPVEATSASGAAVTYTVVASDPNAAVICSPPGAVGIGSATGELQVAIGTTTISCSATNLDGTHSQDFSLTVQDTTPPSLANHGTVNAEATSAAGAVVNYTPPSASDAVDPSPSVNCAPASGSTFPLGDNTVSCTATDNANNTSAAETFTVRVRDTTPPTLSLPGPISETTNVPSGKTVTYSASAQDTVAGAVTPSCNPASGSNFGVGTTTVTCTATDGTNPASGQFTVTVTLVDTTPPTLAPHGNVGPVEATSANGAPVGYSPPTATDNIDPNPAVTCAPPPGAFPLGTTTVTCTATDDSGNTSAAETFTVTVRDTTPPTLGDHGNVSAAATSASGAPVNYVLPTATDLVDASPTVICSPASGTTFPLGVTTVSCTARDHASPANVSAPKTFTVTVADQTPPTLGNHADVTANANSASGAPVPYTLPSATDAVDQSPTVTCAPPPGSTFPLGETTVSCTARDDANNVSPAKTFKVRVLDQAAPTLAAHGPVTAEATSAGGASVNYALPTATDNVDPSPDVSCVPGPGAQFPLGPRTVSCTATDSAGNHSAPTTFTVTVRDTTAPTVAAHSNVSAEATSGSGAVVNYTPPSAADAVDGSPTVTCTPASGSTFPVGSTTVSCTARDDANNTSAPRTFSVNVGDTTAPTFASTPPDLTREASSSTGAKVTYVVPSAVDTVDGPVAVACTPAPGATFALGKSTVTCTAADSKSNSRSVTFSLTVGDATPPVLTVPADLTVVGGSAGGIEAAFPAIQTFLTAAVAVDIVDGPVQVSSQAPAVLPVGTTTVTFNAKDKAGNSVSRTAQVIVLPPGSSAPAPSTVDRRPPANISGLAARPGSGTVRLTWTVPTADFDHVEVFRSTSGDSTSMTRVYSGRGTSFVDRGLTNGTEYRYTVVVFDAAGNRAAGVVITATPRLAMLLAPAEGTRVKATKPPSLVWRAFANAAYYNLQLFRVSPRALNGPAQAGGVKVLSVWPTRTRYQLKRSWKYNGRTYRIAPGTYRWYVFPGFGARADVNYGPLMGQQTFVVRR